MVFRRSLESPRRIEIKEFNLIRITTLLLMFVLAVTPLSADVNPIAVSQIAQGNVYSRTFAENSQTTPNLPMPADALMIVVVTQQNATGGYATVNSTDRTWSPVVSAGQLRGQIVYVSQEPIDTSTAVAIIAPTPLYPIAENSFSWKLLRITGARVGNNGLDAIAQSLGILHQTSYDWSGEVPLSVSSETDSITLAGFAIISQGSPSNVIAGPGFSLVGGPGQTPSIWTQIEASTTTTGSAIMSWTGRKSHWVGWALEIRK